MVSPSSGHASLIGSDFGGYEVQALIGRGAMGTVYLARDVALGRSVALKVLLGSLARNPSTIRGFYREAQAAAPLRHPGIVRIYAAGIERGTPYIAMEYVAGEPLDRFLRRKGQVAWQAALYIGSQVAEALQCAHDAGIVHRDVKPANILLDRHGRARLTDFGIARVRAEQSAVGPKIIGTPQFMSPEQCAGDDITYSTDLYSLGVTLFQTIAGKPPFKAESPQALMRLIATEAAPRLNRVLPDVPDDVARLVAHLLEKEPEKRPANAREVSQTIERLQAEEGGRSAIPKALAAYVREQAQDSPLRVLTPVPAARAKSKAAQAAPRLRVPRTRRVLELTLCALLLLGGATIAMTWFAIRGGPASIPAPVIDVCTFATQANGVTVATVPAKDYRAYRLGWAGKENALLVEARALPTSMARGAAGILSIQPDKEECRSVVSPAGAVLADGAAAAGAAPLALTSGVRSGKASPAVLLGQCIATDEQEISGLIYIQRWNDAAPSLNPALTFTSAPASRANPLNTPARCVHAVLRADGGAICTVVERADGTNYLTEQRVYGSAGVEPLTGAGPRILSETIQYAPAGDRVCYVRGDETGKQELWITPTNGAPSALLAIGYFSGEFSFDASGEQMAVAWSSTPDAPADLRVIATSDGKLLQRLGNATVGHDAWLPDGDALVASVEGENGTRQLWLKNLSRPGGSRALTALQAGVAQATAVSADGRWAAGIANGDAGVRIVLVDLARTMDTRVAVRGGAPANRGPRDA